MLGWRLSRNSMALSTAGAKAKAATQALYSTTAGQQQGTRGQSQESHALRSVRRGGSAALTVDLEEGQDAFFQYGVSPKLIRIGDSYHSNELMAIVNKSGLIGDSTALPGRKRYDNEN